MRQTAKTPTQVPAIIDNRKAKELFVRQRARAILAFRKHASWSKLSYIGRNPVSKLIVLAPIVAQVLIHQPEVAFVRSLDLGMLDWAYWSLISFAFGQIIYSFTCPDDIKNYPNRHEYIKSINSTETDEQLREDAFKIIRKSFADYGGSLEIRGSGLIDFFRERARSEMKRQRDTGQGRFDNPDIETEVVEAVIRLKESLRTGVSPHLNWRLIENNLSLLRKHAFFSENSEKEWSDLHNLNFHISQYATSSHWRVNLLNIRYNDENRSEWKIRVVCAFLYAFGMSYFLYSGLTNMLRVVSRY